MDSTLPLPEKHALSLEFTLERSEGKGACPERSEWEGDKGDGSFVQGSEA